MASEPPTLTNEQAVVAYLRSHPGWCAWHEIYSALAWMDADNLIAALDTLTTYGVVIEDSVELYRLAETRQETKR